MYFPNLPSHSVTLRVYWMIMQVSLGTITKVFQGVYTPSVAHGNGILLQPSHFTRGNKDNLAPRVEITGKLEKTLLSPGDVLFTAKGWEHTSLSGSSVLSLHRDAHP